MHWLNAFVIVRQQPQCFDALLILKRICYRGKTDSVGRTHVAIYMCTKFFGTFMYVETNSSVRSWQILYVNYVLQYVNGNASMDLLYIWYDNRYWSKILFGTTPSPAYDQKVKVTNLEIYVKVLLNKLSCHAHFQFSANQMMWSRLLIQIHILNGKQCRSRSSEANWSGSTLFGKTGYIRVQQD